MPKKYVRILEEVEAIQAKENNLEELRQFAGDVKKVEGEKSCNCYYRNSHLKTPKSSV